MKKSKNIWIIIGITAGLILLATAGRWTNKPKMIYFYGDTCPHCHDVLEYIADNEIRSKLSFRELETYKNINNARLLNTKAKLCRLDTTQGVPVPFFFDGEKCYIGSVEITEFFEEKMAADLTENVDDSDEINLENNEAELNEENNDEVNNNSEEFIDLE